METTRQLPFFVEAVEQFAAGYLADFGFSRVDVSPSRVTCQRGRVLVSFAYYVEDLPSPWVAVDIGLVADDGSRNLVGLWRAIPDDDL